MLNYYLQFIDNKQSNRSENPLIYKEVKILVMVFLHNGENIIIKS